MPLGQLRESSRREEKGDSGTSYHRQQTMPVGGLERSFLRAGRCPFERGWWRKRFRILQALQCVAKETVWEEQ